MPLIAAAIGAVLALPSLRAGLNMDDYHHKLLMQNAPREVRLLEHPLDMFRLLNGDPQRMRELRDYGFAPWWCDLEIKGAFWRPIASATHWLDYALWPQQPALMHAQSIAWYALLAAAAACLYRQVLGPTAVAGLAALLYVIDDAHGMPVGFLSNRNAILSALLGVLALLAHFRWRGAGWRHGAWTGPLLLALSLLAKEEGVAVCAYLFAFAVVLDRGSWRERAMSLLPYAVVVVAWRLVWVGLGYGVRHVDLYVDPLQEPLGFAVAALTRAPVLVLAQLAAPSADVAVLLEGRWLLAFNALAALACIGLLAVVFPVVRSRPTARFWFLGMLLAVLPMCATFPADRMLLMPGLGGMGLLAEFVHWWWKRVGGGPAGAARGLGFAGRRGLTAVVAVLLIVVHGIVAPAAFMWRAAAPLGPRALLAQLFLTEPLDGRVAEQDLIIVNPPVAFACMATPLIWASEKAPLPRHIRILASSAFLPVEVKRLDEYTLEVRPAAGYLATKMDRLCRRDDRPLRAGEEVELPGMVATVLEAGADGRPRSVAFRFPVRLEDASLRWLKWHAGEFVEFEPPRLGEAVELPASWREVLQAATR